jgi:Ca-activated chloride channel homolog
MSYQKSWGFLLLLASFLFADGFIIFPLPNPTPLYVKYHRVYCTIENGVATTVIDQEFVNPLTDELAKGTYVFPIPANATINGFTIVVDGIEKQATTLSKTDARDLFITAIKNSQQASLLEYTQNGALSLEIGNMEPGASRHVHISYTEVLLMTDGLAKYLYPLNTEKYSMRLIDTVSITVTVKNAAPITSVFSPSFPITVDRISASSLTAHYTAIRSRPDRDFDLYYKVSDKALSFHLFAYKTGADDGYFLMLMTPQFKKDTLASQTIAKDMVFTIDRSGSMAGVKIQQARDALTFCVNRLLPADFFNIVMFNHEVATNSQELLPALGNIAQALEYVNTITADGNTDISLALTTSLAKIKESDRPHYLIFLTDGRPTAGVTNDNQISANVNAANTKNTRIFSVGFGFDVNTVLIDKLSIDNNGYPLYCNPDQSIEQVISDLYKRIEAPILTSPEISIISSGSAVTTYGISPEKLPDLFAGSEIAVYGRYHGSGEASVSLTGRVKENSDTLSFTANFPDSLISYAFIPRLWATQHIGRLMTRIKLQTMTQENLTALVDSVKALSLAYGIVTPYTSQVFVQDGSGGSLSGTLQLSSGKSANDASNLMQGMQQNSNAAQTMVADTNSVPYTVAPRLNQIQNASNKAFVFASDSIWKDASFDSTKPSDTIYYGTDEYFALADKSRDLLDLLSVGNQTAFNYQGQNYLILDKNKATIAVKNPMNREKILMKTSPVFAIVNKRHRVIFTGLSGANSGSITIYSAAGSIVAKMTLRGFESSIVWETSLAQGSGTYFVVYKTVTAQQIKKFILTR